MNASHWTIAQRNIVALVMEDHSQPYAIRRVRKNGGAKVYRIVDWSTRRDMAVVVPNLMHRFVVVDKATGATEFLTLDAAEKTIGSLVGCALETLKRWPLERLEEGLAR